MPSFTTEKSVFASCLLLALLSLTVGLKADPASASGSPKQSATVTAASAACQAPSPSHPVIGIPAYMWADDAWSSVVDAVPPGSLVIFNPDSGPGAAPSAHFAAQVQEATQHGVCLLGYVQTEYGQRAAGDVLTDVAHYRKWYGVTSIFFDEASSATSQLAYYTRLADSVHRVSGALVAFNPGTVPDSGYGNIADLLVLFEGNQQEFATFNPPSWLPTERARGWALVYGVAPDDELSALDYAGQAGMAAAYVTDDTLPNPWDAVPSYWSTEIAQFGS